MRIAILTFDGFNELDSLIASAMLNRVRQPRFEALITSPTTEVTSMNGVVVRSQAPLSFVRQADGVIVGSGVRTRELIQDPRIMEALSFDARQLVGAQCSGALFLAKLGLLASMPACTDSTTRPWLEAEGVTVLDRPFFAKGNVATAGGCLGSHYLAGWMIARLAGWDAAAAVLHYVAPVGEKDAYVERAFRAIGEFLPKESSRRPSPVVG